MLISSADFIVNFGLRVDMSKGTLEDTNMKISIKGTRSSSTAAGISTTIPETNGLQHLLQYLELLKAFNYN